MKRIYVSVFRIDRIEGRSAYGACYGLLLAKGDGPKYISVIATTKIPSQESLCGICLYFRQQGTADESAEQNRRGIAGEGYLEIVHGRKDKRKMVETACGSGQKTAIMREYCVWTAECFCLTTAG